MFLKIKDELINLKYVEKIATFNENIEIYFTGKNLEFNIGFDTEEKAIEEFKKICWQVDVYQNKLSAMKQ